MTINMKIIIEFTLQYYFRIYVDNIVSPGMRCDFNQSSRFIRSNSRIFISMKTNLSRRVKWRVRICDRVRQFVSHSKGAEIVVALQSII